MNKVCFFDTKPYDKIYFDMLKEDYQIEIDYFESKLGKKTALMAKGYDVVIVKTSPTMIVHWAMQYGMAVEILDEEIRKKIREEIVGMAEKYAT